MKHKGLFQPLALATILALGFLAVWAVVGVVAAENARMVSLQSGAEESIVLRADGTALIAHAEAGEISHRDLNGVGVAVSEDDPIGGLIEATLPTSLSFREPDSEWDNRIRFFSDGRRPQTAWYFLADGRPDGTAYFVGYDSHTKAKIGYLGTSGFRAEMPPPQERFPFAGATRGGRLQAIGADQDARSRRASGKRRRPRIDEADSVSPSLVYVLGLDSRIYEADLRKRTVRIALQERDIRSFTILDIVQSSPADMDWRLVVRTDRDVLLLSKHGSEHKRYPIPEELRELRFSFGQSTAGEAVMQWGKEHSVMDTESAHRLFWVQPDGRTRTVSLTLPSRPVPLRIILTALLPSPLAQAVVGVIRIQELQEGVEPTFSSACVRLVRELWPAWLLIQLLAAGLAVLCYRRQVRYGSSRTERVAWPLFVLLWGLPGWIGYRFGRSWPVLASCPECGVAVPRDRHCCLRCTHDFLLPALKGTEVFA